MRMSAYGRRWVGVGDERWSSTPMPPALAVEGYSPSVLGAPMRRVEYSADIVSTSQRIASTAALTGSHDGGRWRERAGVEGKPAKGDGRHARPDMGLITANEGPPQHIEYRYRTRSGLYVALPPKDHYRNRHRLDYLPAYPVRPISPMARSDPHSTTHFVNRSDASSAPSTPKARNMYNFPFIAGQPHAAFTASTRTRFLRQQSRERGK